MEERDLIIIGGGVAGLTAGIYGARKGLDTLILEAELPAGQAALSPLIENYPGFPEGISGAELVKRMAKQAERFGVQINTMEPAIGFSLRKDKKVVTTEKGSYEAKAVIIAIGAKPLHLPERLGAKGEEEFIGRGVSYCATCDGPLFKNKKVVIVGSSNETVTDALYLADLNTEVTLITPAEKLEADEVLLKRLKERVKIRNADIKAIKGKSLVESIVIEENGKEKILEASGVFITLGRKAPSSEIFEKAGVKCSEKGFITVDRYQRTSIEGVYAAGDVTGDFFQVSKAVGEGAIAAMHSYKYIRRKRMEKEEET
jgi:thioredoxin reductase (NADPH)